MEEEEEAAAPLPLLLPPLLLPPPPLLLPWGSLRAATAGAALGSCTGFALLLQN